MVGDRPPHSRDDGGGVDSLQDERPIAALGERVLDLGNLQLRFEVGVEEVRFPARFAGGPLTPFHVAYVNELDAANPKNATVLAELDVVERPLDP